MAPAIPTGAVGISFRVDANTIRIGDVISVENAAGVRITHRVVLAETSGDTTTVTLKGDANSVPDAALYTLRGADLVILHVPLLGYAVAWLSSSAAVFAGGLFTAYLLYLAFGAPARRRSQSEPPEFGPRPRAGHRVRIRGRRATRFTAMALAGLSVLTGGALNTATPSQAAFLDAARATAAFTAASLAAPTLSCQNSGLYDVTLTLTHAGDFADRYELRTLAPAKLWASAAWQPGTPVSVLIDADDSVFSSQTASVEFRASSSSGAWASAPALKNVRYTPPLLAIPLISDLIPATLRCVA